MSQIVEGIKENKTGENWGWKIRGKNQKRKNLCKNNSGEKFNHHHVIRVKYESLETVFDINPIDKSFPMLQLWSLTYNGLHSQDIIESN